MKNLAILWGSSGAYGNDGVGNKTVYMYALDLIKEGAKQHGFEPHLVLYPGHPDENGTTNGTLSFCSALLKVLDDCRKLQPEWIIGRSLGALLAPAALSCGGDWVKVCRGAVMWGPGFKTYMDAEWPTAERKAAAIASYLKHGTRLASDYFDTIPEVESLVPGAKSNLRFARGTADKYNSNGDLKRLELLHSAAQPGFKRRVVFLERVDHTPTRWTLSAEQIQCYFNCLFDVSFTHNTAPD